MHTLRQLSNISNVHPSPMCPPSFHASTLLPCVHPPLTLEVFIHVHYFVSAVDSSTTVNVNYIGECIFMMPCAMSYASVSTCIAHASGARGAGIRNCG